jgi:hypothetical protein
MRRRTSFAPTGISYLPIPDPRTWPVEARERFRALTGASGALDVFIFVSGPFAAMYLQDAVTAAGILEIEPSEWQTEGGYPAFCFHSERVQEYAGKLTSAGYAVQVLEPAEQIREQPTESGGRAEVISIARGWARWRIL